MDVGTDGSFAIQLNHKSSKTIVGVLSTHPQMNPLLLTVSIMVAVIALVMIIILIFYRGPKNIAVNPYEGNCSVDLSTLVPVADQCCVINNQATDDRPMVIQGITFTIGRSPVPYENVCSAFCSNYDATGRCTSFIDEGQYDTCQSLLKPIGCNGSARPVGTDGIQMFYAQSVGTVNCPRTQKCSQL